MAAETPSSAASLKEGRDLEKNDNEKVADEQPQQDELKYDPVSWCASNVLSWGLRLMRNSKVDEGAVYADEPAATEWNVGKRASHP